MKTIKTVSKAWIMLLLVLRSQWYPCLHCCSSAYIVYSAFILVFGMKCLFDSMQEDDPLGEDSDSSIMHTPGEDFDGKRDR